MSQGPSRLRRVFLDTAPLRLDPGYRMLWAGQAVNGIGTQITRVALPYQVYVLTGSTLAIAALTACQLVPLLVFSLGAGSIADAVDRRRLLAITQVGMAACSAALVLLSLGGSPPVLAIFAVAFVSWSFSAFDQPARASSVPRLVPPSRLPAAIALNQLNFQLQSVIGPAFGGLLIATVGLPGAYGVDVLSFGASLIALTRIPPIPPLGEVARPGISAIREALGFLRTRRVILSTFVIDLDAMIFGMPTSLFPVLALDVFRTGPTGVGLLAAAPAAGAFVGALLSGWLSHVRRPGRAVIVAVAIWGVAIVAFGLATFWFPLALACLALAGAADVFSAVLRGTIVQLETPDELRGRVASVNGLVVRSGPALGDIEAAAVASVVGAQASVISGGILCLVGLLGVVRAFPELGRHADALPATEQVAG
ncbi:MAG TPA: MFS transporter [Candidatus Limnocylindrales bacterium]|nr:MFS transporter [Candidatus Limnocylindrales bacterium]